VEKIMAHSLLSFIDWAISGLILNLNAHSFPVLVSSSSFNLLTPCRTPHEKKTTRFVYNLAAASFEFE
jgi:hypothetical protein